MTLSIRTAEHHAAPSRIDAVHTHDEIPRRYRSHGVDPFTARLVLKVPRDRRSRAATTDRYERLLVLQDDALEVLTRNGSGFTAMRVPYAGIVAVRDRVDLLDGLLTLHTSDGTTIPIPFTASSSEVVGDLTDLLVRLASATAGVVHPLAGPRGEPVTPHVDLGKEEAGIASAFWALVARDPELAYLSSHPRLPLRPSATGVSGTLRRARPLSLAGTIAACSPREVLILTRREQVLRRRAATVSIDRLHLLRHAITSTTSEPHPHWVGMSTLTMHAGAAAFQIIVATTTALGCDLLTVGG